MVKEGRVGWDGQSHSEVPITSPIGFTDTWMVMRAQSGVILAEVVATHAGGIDRDVEHRVTWSGFCNKAAPNRWGAPNSGIRDDGYLIPRSHTLIFEVFVSDRMPLRWTAVGMGKLVEGAWKPERLFGRYTMPFRQEHLQVFRDGKLYWWRTTNHRRLVGRGSGGGQIGWTYHGWSQWPESQWPWVRSAEHPRPYSGGAGGQSDGAQGRPRKGENWSYIAFTDGEGETDMRTGKIPAYSIFQRTPSGWADNGLYTCDQVGLGNQRIMPGQSINYAIPEQGAKWVQFHLYNQPEGGMKRVRTKRIEATGHILSTGTYRWDWDGRGDDGEKLGIGFYAIHGQALLQNGQKCDGGFAIEPWHVDSGTGKTPGNSQDPSNVSDISILDPPPTPKGVSKYGSALWLMLPLAALALNR